MQRQQRAIMIPALLAIALGAATAIPVRGAGEAPYTIVTLGDSITKGVRPGVAADETFAAIVQQRLKEEGLACRVINEGVGGEQSDQALARLEQILGHKPRIVTVMYGTNDCWVDKNATESRVSLDQFRANLEQIVHKLLLNGVEPILMTEPRYARQSELNGVGEHPNLRLEKYVDVTRSVARDLDVLLIDNFGHWTTADAAGVNLSDWTTDGYHPNPVGHRQIAELMSPLLKNQMAHSVMPVGFRIERKVVLQHDDGQSLWFHPRVAAFPSASGTPSVVMTLQKHLMTSDHYSGLSMMLTGDLGETWSGPTAPEELDWVRDGDVDIAVADVTPGFHPKTGKVLAVGAQVRYSATGEQLEDQPRANQTAYAVFDPATNAWTPWKRLEMPPGNEFNMARSACAQFVVEDDGTVLLPFYIGPSTAVPFSVTVVRCAFDGDELRYVEHGDVLSLNVVRGLCEPSLIRFADRYYMTIRNDLQGYVTTSADGLHFRPMKLWTFDDGTELGSYNTQQHWVAQNGGLFLSYTRRGANNDHIMRHRAPLFIAQVDPDRLHVIRDTEQELLPERGATLGNFGAARVTEHESWVTVAEGIWSDDARQRGAEGAVWMARVIDDEAPPPSTPQTMAKLLAGDDEVRVVCFGDSVTGLYYHTGGRRAYTDQLAIALKRLCPRAKVTTINAGISGNTTRDALARIDADVLAKQPSLVTVMFGLNDMVRVPLEEYRANLIAIVEKVRAVGAEVILCTPNSVITTTGRPVEKLVEYCDVVRDVAKRHDVPLCDVFESYELARERDSAAWRLWMSDEIHPNHDGHKAIAEQIARTITGRSVSLADVPPLRPALPHTFAKLRSGEPIRMLAMPPFNESGLAFGLVQGASIDVHPWRVQGLSVVELEQDAKARVREMKPDLVIISIPRSAHVADREEFIRAFAWVMNWSLSFGRQEWDVVVVHPDVVDPQDSDEETDELIRRLVAAQDLTLVDRLPGSTEHASKIFNDWLDRQWRFAPAP